MNKLHIVKAVRAAVEMNLADEHYHLFYTTDARATAELHYVEEDYRHVKNCQKYGRAYQLGTVR